MKYSTGLRKYYDSVTRKKKIKVQKRKGKKIFEELNDDCHVVINPENLKPFLDFMMKSILWLCWQFSKHVFNYFHRIVGQFMSIYCPIQNGEKFWIF